MEAQKPRARRKAQDLILPGSEPENVPNSREQAWLDQLPVEELAVTERLRSMTGQMQSAWLGVEIYRLRRQLERTEMTFAETLTKTNKATADAITAALKAATPTVINNGQRKGWTLNPTVAAALGAALVGGAYALARILGAA